MAVVTRAWFKHLLASSALICGGSVTLDAHAGEPTGSLYQVAEPDELFDSRLVGTSSNTPVSVAPPISCGPGGDLCGPAAPPSATPAPYAPEPYAPQPYAPEQSQAPMPSQDFGSLSSGQGALTAQNSMAASLMPGGYLDPAAPVTQFRLRYDDGINNQFPDRGEYFYAKCGCFRTAGLDPNAAGPQGVNASVNYQDIRPYMEYAFAPRLSIFGELPVRSVNFFPSTQADPRGQLGRETGLGDMNAGFKYALIADPNEFLTFQLRTYIPTGNAAQGLGTHHVSIEPSLLYYRRLSNRWQFQSQLTEFAPIGGSEFASNVIQYGAGLGYWAVQGNRMSVMPTLEVVGWTFIGGQKFNPDFGQSSASGDTIVNLKPGVRFGIGPMAGPMMFQRHSIYTGFGIPMTGEQFYSNLFRVEYRYVF